MKNLIVYFSRKGQNYWNGSIKNLSKGNTEIVAEFIQKFIGGDLFEVETIKPYSDDYYECIDEAKKELYESSHPEIKAYVNDMDQYDKIFVGYPNWWGTMPRAMFTFLEHYDLSDKWIIPFCTNEGSGMGTSERDLKRICKNATIMKGLAIHGAEAKDSEAKVVTWIKKGLSL